jgi:hypothetical protein
MNATLGGGALGHPKVFINLVWRTKGVFYRSSYSLMNK